MYLRRLRPGPRECSVGESFRPRLASYGRRFDVRLPTETGGLRMKRTSVIVFTVFAASAIVMAQGRGAPAPPQALEAGASQAEVDRALLAAPANLRNGAMVIKWSADRSSYTTLRKANEGNNLVCYDRSGFPVQQAFSVECTQSGNLDRVKQNMQIE